MSSLGVRGVDWVIYRIKFYKPLKSVLDMTSEKYFNISFSTLRNNLGSKSS